MPLEFVTGSIFERDSQLLVCPVNTYGVAGAGLALEFKHRFPAQVEFYRKSCARRTFKPGQILVDKESLDDEPVILFAATKDNWRYPSKSQWVWDCLEGINLFLIDNPRIEIASIPALGCGLGRLAWPKVKHRMTTVFHGLSRCRILAFQPAIK